MSTITRKELADAIRERLPDLTQPEAMRLFNEALEEIAAAAASGENVKLSGFGSFLVRAKRERVGRNPKTREEARISPRRVMTFHPSLLLRAAVNRPKSHGPDDDQPFHDGERPEPAPADALASE
ncbi:HU family DNA-binding protein [Methylocystis parvus]|uniref:HU family DNA-binding protein n=1 Tax=Methylocystis parvus TaxID=134 RepID=UPI003C708F81